MSGGGIGPARTDGGGLSPARTEEGKIYQRPFGGHMANFGERALRDIGLSRYDVLMSSKDSRN